MRDGATDGAAATVSATGPPQKGLLGSGRDGRTRGCWYPPGFCGVPPAGAGLLGDRTMNLFKNTLRVWAMHREFRAVLAELTSYSDRALNERGLARGDGARAAYEEAERHIMPRRPTSRAETPAGAGLNPAPAAGR